MTTTHTLLAPLDSSVRRASQGCMRERLHRIALVVVVGICALISVVVIVVVSTQKAGNKGSLDGPWDNVSFNGNHALCCGYTAPLFIKDKRLQLNMSRYFKTFTFRFAYRTTSMLKSTECLLTLTGNP